MLEVTDIQLNYGKKQVLRQVSFHADAGMCIGILGTNGCGKSTLLKVLAGVLPPKSGSVSYNGENACQNQDLFVQYAGYVPQDNPLIEELTVRDNLKLWYAGSASDMQAELEQGVLHMLELHTVLKSKVCTLSGGLKKRLSIGIALANRPQVLILDEPTTALDLPCKAQIRSYLRLYLQNGGAVIITTHEEPDLDLCHRLLVLQDGILREIPRTARGKELSNYLLPSGEAK